MEFQTLLDRVKSGDQDAAASLVDNYEPLVRRFIRFRLTSPSLRRTFDSLDICQSVLSKFFVEISAGDLELNDPAQLRALLLTMARNKLYDRVRDAQADRRDVRRMEGTGDEALAQVAQPGESPSEVMAAKEILNLVQEQLSDDERYLIEQRMSGTPWEQLAAQLGASPEALRKRMTRAIDDAAKRIGFRENANDVKSTQLRSER
ncbi:RNA polymerase sigma factor [Schlesneria paludicola]|uniref:RNA polymerase sigma factor n=1 Tax=Schlesneria paludicola TaxID=360056 RepID=UPI00029B4872|nr:sigma-70 family RNA polymerase sigma factor [Schlesneria paludicola]